MYGNGILIDVLTVNEVKAWMINYITRFYVNVIILSYIARWFGNCLSVEDAARGYLASHMLGTAGGNHEYRLCMEYYKYSRYFILSYCMHIFKHCHLTKPSLYVLFTYKHIYIYKKMRVMFWNSSNRVIYWIEHWIDIGPKFRRFTCLKSKNFIQNFMGWISLRKHEYVCDFYIIPRRWNVSWLLRLTPKKDSNIPISSWLSIEPGKWFDIDLD